MASNSNFAVSAFSETGSTIDGIMSGKKWLQTTLTYSFPDSVADFAASYLGNYHLGAAQVSAQTMLAVERILADVSLFTGLEFVETDDDWNALLRVTMTSTLNDFGFPGGGASAGSSGGVYDTNPWKKYAGDTWISSTASSDWNSTTQEPGNRGYYLLMHEFGHNLGLKHPHDDGGTGWPSLDPDLHGLAWTVMSYKSAPGYSDNFSDNNPQTYMPLDILAMQTMYGADFGTRSGDTTYTWNTGQNKTFADGVEIAGGGDYIWASVWDGGGVDTYDFSNVHFHCEITLQAGGYSTIDHKAYLFFDGERVTAPGNIANPFRFDGSEASLIENVISGPGNDTLQGNKINNILTGGDGEDLFVFKNKWGVDTITDFTDGIDLIQVEKKNNEPTIQQLLDSTYQHNNKVVIEWLDSKIKLQGFDLVNIDASDFV